MAVAMGSGVTASGNVSTAIGVNTTASSYSSTAMGSGVTASGAFSTAMGVNSTASGELHCYGWIHNCFFLRGDLNR